MLHRRREKKAMKVVEGKKEKGYGCVMKPTLRLLILGQ